MSRKKKTRREWRREQGRGENRKRGGNDGISGDEKWDGRGNRDGIREGKENGNGEGIRGGGKFGHQSDRETRKVEDQVLPFRERYHRCRQEVTIAGSQQHRAQNPEPARQCSTERTTGHQGREGENDDGKRDGGGNGNRNENVDGNSHEGRDGSENGSGNGDHNKEV